MGNAMDIQCKKMCSLHDNIDMYGMCMDFAGAVGGFGALDDMDVLISGKYVHNGVVYQKLVYGEVITDKSCVYLNYLLDALNFLYTNNVSEAFYKNTYTSAGDKPEIYSKYIEHFYGSKYKSDGNIIKTAICQSGNFLISAWEVIKSNKNLDEAFKNHLRSIYS